MGRTRSSKPAASRQGTNTAKIADGDDAAGDAANGGVPTALLSYPDSTHDREAYAVGYSRPPLESRFKHGQSGNPKGREKQSRNMRTILQQVLSEDMQIREGGRVRRIPKFEALVRTTLSRAFKGDPKATTSLLILVKHFGNGPDHDAPAAELLAGTDLKAIIGEYIDRNVLEPQTPTEAALETSNMCQTAPSATSPKNK